MLLSIWGELEGQGVLPSEMGYAEGIFLGRL